jgi:hypothetical protein
MFFTSKFATPFWLTTERNLLAKSGHTSRSGRSQRFISLPRPARCHPQLEGKLSQSQATGALLVNGAHTRCKIFARRGRVQAVLAPLEKLPHATARSASSGMMPWMWNHLEYLRDRAVRARRGMERHAERIRERVTGIPEGIFLRSQPVTLFRHRHSALQLVGEVQEHHDFVLLLRRFGGFHRRHHVVNLKLWRRWSG